LQNAALESLYSAGSLQQELKSSLIRYIFWLNLIQPVKYKALGDMAILDNFGQNSA